MKNVRNAKAKPCSSASASQPITPSTEIIPHPPDPSAWAAITKIIVDDMEFAVVTEKLPRGVLGEVEMNKRVIKLSPKLHKEDVAAVIGHEIIHIYLMRTGMGGFLSHEQQEALCDGLGYLLTRTHYKS